MLNITKGTIKQPQKITIYGVEGIGKTSLAAQFPNPLFIDTEGGSSHLDVARLDTPQSWQMLLSYIQQLRQNTMGYKTLVIDTVDWAETLAVSHICSMNQKNSIEDFGYGKGYVLLEEEVGKLLNELSRLITAGMNVVLTAHASVRKFEQPDEQASYDRYELKLGKKTGGRTSSIVKEWSDCVIFLNYKNTILTTNGKSKAVQSKRVMYTTRTPAWDAKNRYGLEDMYPDISFEPLKPHIPAEAVATVAEPVATKIAPDPVPTPAPKAKPAPKKKAEAPKEPPKEPKNHEEIQKEPPAQTDTILDTERIEVEEQLHQLLDYDNVTLEEVQACVVDRGKYPAGTPFENYDTEFIQGWIIAYWSNIVNFILENRK